MDNRLNRLTILNLHLFDLRLHELNQISRHKADIRARVITNSNLTLVSWCDLRFLQQIRLD